MQVTVKDGVFVAHTAYAERHAPSEAGFWWHGGKCKPHCKACALGLGKTWWTPKLESAARLYKYADPAAKALLEGHVKAVKASKATDASIEIPAPTGLSYRPYQKAGVSYAMEHKSTLLADEMGLGKTIQVLGLVNMLPVKSVLVVCPGSLRLNWLREAELWIDRPFSYHVIESSAVPPEDVNFVIVNYERIIGDDGALIYNWLMSRKWDLLVADECHYLKNPKAQRTIAVLGRREPQIVKNPVTGENVLMPICDGLVHQADRKMFLTGTPLPNRPLEVFPISQALAPSLFSDRKFFRRRYAKGTKYLPELQEKLRANFMIRRLKAEVEKDLPPKLRQVIAVPPGSSSDLIQQEKDLWQAKEEAIAQFKAEKLLAHAAGDTVAYQKALVALKDTVQAAFQELSKIRHKLALDKVPLVVEHIESMREAGIKKIIVFAHHKDVIAQIADAFKGKSVVLTGDTPMNKRQAIVDQFQNDPETEVFVGGFKAAGVGFTLTAASYVVMAEQDWSPYVISQAEDRAHRIGQVHTVFVHHVVFDESLDARMAHYIVEKQNIADKVLDTDTEIDGFDMALPVGPAKAIDATVAPLPKKYPPTTPKVRALAKQAMQIIAGLCDGAKKLDGQGFSKVDVKIGKALASVAGEYTDGQVFVARRLAKIYHKQLPADLLAELGFNKAPKKG